MKTDRENSLEKHPKRFPSQVRCRCQVSEKISQISGCSEISQSPEGPFSVNPNSILNFLFWQYFSQIDAFWLSVKLILQRPLTRFHTGGYYTNWNIMGLEDPPTSGSTRGSLGALNKLF